MSSLIERQAAIETVRKAKSIGQAHRMLVQLPSAQPGQRNARVFQGIIVEYPSISTYPEYEGKPYFSIKYTENGQEFIGYGTYKPEVLSEYLKEYFMPPTQPGWIPCSERCPERYDNYLITTEDGMVVFGVYDPREKQWCRYDSIKSWWIYGIKVLAWQPLPTPYREGGQDETD